MRKWTGGWGGEREENKKRRWEGEKLTGMKRKQKVNFSFSLCFTLLKAILLNISFPHIQRYFKLFFFSIQFYVFVRSLWFPVSSRRVLCVTRFKRFKNLFSASNPSARLLNSILPAFSRSKVFTTFRSSTDNISLIYLKSYFCLFFFIWLYFKCILKCGRLWAFIWTLNKLKLKIFSIRALWLLLKFKK